MTPQQICLSVFGNSIRKQSYLDSLPSEDVRLQIEVAIVEVVRTIHSELVPIGQGRNSQQDDSHLMDGQA